MTESCRSATQQNDALYITPREPAVGRSELCKAREDNLKEFTK